MSLNNCDVVLRSAGRGAQAVVLVHGIGVSSRYFGPLAAELARDCTVYAVELPGFGSAPRPSRTLDVPDLGGILAGVLARLGLTDVVLIGHSMGCQVVAEAARQAPHMVQRLVLLAPTVNDRERSAVMQGLRLLQDTLHEPAGVNWIVFSDYVRSCIQYARTLRPMLEHRLEDVLGSVICPAHIVRGEKDPIVPGDWVGRLVGACPGVTTDTVAGAPHVFMYEGAAQTARCCMAGKPHAPA